MIEAPFPVDEDKRQLALEQSHLIEANPAPFDTLTTLARSIFNVPMSLVTLIDKNRQFFLSHNGLDATEAPRNTSFCGHVLLESDILVIEDALKDDRFHNNPFVIDNPNVRFYAGVPIRVTAKDGKRLIVGSFCLVAMEPRSFGQFERDKLKLLGKAVEEQIILAQKEYELSQQVSRDSLTNLLNRHGLQQVGQKMIAAAERNLLMTAGDCLAANITALFLDLDGFKPLNDRLGHSQGDIALQDFGRLLQSVNREGSSVCSRQGGDEYIVLMGNADRAAAKKMLTRFDAALATYNAQETRFQLRYSVGIAEWRKGITLDALVHEADEQMYRDKQQRKAS